MQWFEATTAPDWESIIQKQAQRSDRELSSQTLALPPDLARLPFVIACQHDSLSHRLGVSFAQAAPPKKNEACLDLGCGLSFMLYPWTEWQAKFYGLDVSLRCVDFIKSRAPQLNSKLFKGIYRSAAHRIEDTALAELTFDRVIAQGLFAYYPPEYAALVWLAIAKRVQPKALFIFDVVNPESRWLDEWGMVEMHHGVEPILAPLSEWEALIKTHKGTIRRQAKGELFVTYVVELPSHL